MSQTPPPAAVTIERRGSAVLARLSLKLPTEADVSALSQLIDQAAKDAGVSVVVIDLSGIEILPSLGLGALVQMCNKCKARQQKLKLAAAGPELRQVLTITRLDRYLELVDTVEAGLA